MNFLYWLSDWWLVSIMGLVASIFGIIQFFAWLRKPNTASENDISALRDHFAEQMGQLRAELRIRQVIWSGVDADSLDDDLMAGIQTLVQSGNIAALRDTSGNAGREAIDHLIRQPTKDAIHSPQEEASLYRQKGAFAFLHDRQQAIDAYRQAIEINPRDGESLNALGLLQMRTGEIDEAEHSFERLRSVGQETGRQEWVVSANGNLALIYKARGELDLAETIILDNLQKQKTLKDKIGIAKSIGNLGVIFFLRDKLDKSEKFFEKSLEISNHIGCSEEIATCYGNLGLIHYKRGNASQAEQFFKKQLELADKEKLLEHVENASSKLGLLYKMTGSIIDAETAFRRSRDLSKTLKMWDSYAVATANLGYIYQKQGKIESAIDMLLESIDTDGQAGFTKETATKLITLATIYENNGNYINAEKFFVKGKKLANQFGNEKLQLVAAIGLTLVYSEEVNYEKTIKAFEDVIALKKSLKDYDNLIDDYESLSGILLKKGQIQKAFQSYQEYLYWAERLGHKEGQANACVNLGAIYGLKGDSNIACEHWSRARNLFREIGSSKVQDVSVLMQRGGCRER